MINPQNDRSDAQTEDLTEAPLSESLGDDVAADAKADTNEDPITPPSSETPAPSSNSVPHGSRHSRHLHAEDLRLVPIETRRRRRHSHAHHHRKKRHPVRKALLIVLCCLLSIVLIATATFFLLRENGRKQLLDAPTLTLTVPEEADAAIEIHDDEQRVFYNGHTYTFNKARTNILCMGTDKDSLGLDDDTVGTGGQADTIMLLSVDTDSGQMDIVTVSRDTMVDIDLYTVENTYYGVQNAQICLAYAYGDGREKSCENLSRSVQRLLYGIPINTYFSMDLSTIGVLNDAVGGVSVTLLEDFTTAEGFFYPAGETHTLFGDNAMQYVRSRDKTQLDSNNLRMERQKQYLTAFFEKAMTATKADLTVPVQLFQTVSSDAISNLDAAKITFLATTLLEHQSQPHFCNVPGTVVAGENGDAQYLVDEKATFELVLDVFYTRID